jgi:hypothetical protein
VVVVGDDLQACGRGGFELPGRVVEVVAPVGDGARDLLADAGDPAKGGLGGGRLI